MNTKTYLAKLFNETDYVYTAGPLKPEGGYSDPSLVELAKLDALTGKQFFSINSLNKVNNLNVKPNGSKGSVRASINVTNFRNFLLESDSIEVKLQRDLIPYLNNYIPIRLATFSGSKSIHMIVSVADTLFNSNERDPVGRYKQIWEGLCNKAEQHTKVFLTDQGLETPNKIFDTACKDPARLSRLPGAFRTTANGVVEQSVVFEGGLVAADELLVLASEVKLKQYSGTTTVNLATDLSSFERKLRTIQSLSFLRDRLEYPDRWTSSTNMYTELFKYALWCLDATSVPFPILDAYLTKKVYPSILAKGYPRNPRAGVLAAYEFKGLL